MPPIAAQASQLPTEQDLALLRRTIALSEQSRARGRHPFAALVADEHGNVISEADGQERLIIADIDLSDRGGSQTASVSGTETARVVRMMETESGIGMLTVNYVVMAELRRI